MHYPATQVLGLFARDASELQQQTLTDAHGLLLGQAELGSDGGRRRVRGYSAEKVTAFGATYGYLQRPKKTYVVSLFVTKGGVLKTSLTLNLARMAALQGLKTCVVGLDMQCDITTALGLGNEDLDDSSLQSSIEEVDPAQGLFDYYEKRVSFDPLIQPTDLPLLKAIPETPELVVLEKMIFQKSRREFWLQDSVVTPLKNAFDLIIFDCSPSWNLLTTNALVASDLVVSPLECKINNYRNFNMFRSFMNEFRQDLRLTFQHLYLPTRLNSQRRLSREIYEWYLEHAHPILPLPFRESTSGEEAVASHLSIPEHAPGSSAAIEMNQILHWMGQCWTDAFQLNQLQPREVQLHGDFSEGY